VADATRNTGGSENRVESVRRDARRAPRQEEGRNAGRKRIRRGLATVARVIRGFFAVARYAVVGIVIVGILLSIISIFTATRLAWSAATYAFAPYMVSVNSMDAYTSSVLYGNANGIAPASSPIEWLADAWGWLVEHLKSPREEVQKDYADYVQRQKDSIGSRNISWDEFWKRVKKAYDDVKPEKTGGLYDAVYYRSHLPESLGEVKQMFRGGAVTFDYSGLATALTTKVNAYLPRTFHSHSTSPAPVSDFHPPQSVNAGGVQVPLVSRTSKEVVEVDVNLGYKLRVVLLPTEPRPYSASWERDGYRIEVELVPSYHYTVGSGGAEAPVITYTGTVTLKKGDKILRQDPFAFRVPAGQNFVHGVSAVPDVDMARALVDMAVLERTIYLPLALAYSVWGPSGFGVKIAKAVNDSDTAPWATSGFLVAPSGKLTISTNRPVAMEKAMFDFANALAKLNNYSLTVSGMGQSFFSTDMGFSSLVALMPAMTVSDPESVYPLWASYWAELSAYRARAFGMSPFEVARDPMGGLVPAFLLLATPYNSLVDSGLFARLVYSVAQFQGNLTGYEAGYPALVGYRILPWFAGASESVINTNAQIQKYTPWVDPAGRLLPEVAWYLAVNLYKKNGEEFVPPVVLYMLPNLPLFSSSQGEGLQLDEGRFWQIVVPMSVDSRGRLVPLALGLDGLQKNLLTAHVTGGGVVPSRKDLMNELLRGIAPVVAVETQATGIHVTVSRRVVGQANYATSATGYIASATYSKSKVEKLTYTLAGSPLSTEVSTPFLYKFNGGIEMAMSNSLAKTGKFILAGLPIPGFETPRNGLTGGDIARSVGASSRMAQLIDSFSVRQFRVPGMNRAPKRVVNVTYTSEERESLRWRVVYLSPSGAVIGIKTGGYTHQAPQTQRTAVLQAHVVETFRQGVTAGMLCELIKRGYLGSSKVLATGLRDARFPTDLYLYQNPVFYINTLIMNKAVDATVDVTRAMFYMEAEALIKHFIQAQQSDLFHEVVRKAATELYESFLLPDNRAVKVGLSLPLDKAPPGTVSDSYGGLRQILTHLSGGGDADGDKKYYDKQNSEFYSSDIRPLWEAVAVYWLTGSKVSAANAIPVLLMSVMASGNPPVVSYLRDSIGSLSPVKDPAQMYETDFWHRLLGSDTWKIYGNSYLLSFLTQQGEQEDVTSFIGGHAVRLPVMMPGGQVVTATVVPLGLTAQTVYYNPYYPIPVECPSELGFRIPIPAFVSLDDMETLVQKMQGDGYAGAANYIQQNFVAKPMQMGGRTVYVYYWNRSFCLLQPIPQEIYGAPYRLVTNFSGQVYQAYFYDRYRQIGFEDILMERWRHLFDKGQLLGINWWLNRHVLSGSAGDLLLGSSHGAITRYLASFSMDLGLVDWLDAYSAIAGGEPVLYNPQGVLASVLMGTASLGIAGEVVTQTGTVGGVYHPMMLVREYNTATPATTSPETVLLTPNTLEYMSEDMTYFPLPTEKYAVKVMEESGPVPVCSSSGLWDQFLWYLAYGEPAVDFESFSNANALLTLAWMKKSTDATPMQCFAPFEDPLWHYLLLEH